MSRIMDKPNKRHCVEQVLEEIDRLKRNRKEIAMNISESTDYNSFLQGFDYVIDKLSQVMKWRFIGKRNGDDKKW